MSEINHPYKIGQALEGGFFTGFFVSNGVTYALVTAPKALEIEGAWGEYGTLIEGADSFHDGFANTKEMAAAGCEIATKVIEVGFYIPSRDELEMQYRAFKPTSDENYVHRHGDNPSRLPPGYPYTETSPAKTALDAFKECGEEAFDGTWYWSSTQCSASNAWSQYFDDGYQDDFVKYDEGRVRPVRRIQIVQ